MTPEIRKFVKEVWKRNHFEEKKFLLKEIFEEEKSRSIDYINIQLNNDDY